MPTALLRPRYLRAALGAASKVSLLQLERDEGAPLEPLAMGLADAGRRWPRPIDDRNIKIVVGEDGIDVELLDLFAFCLFSAFVQCSAMHHGAQSCLRLD